MCGFKEMGPILKYKNLIPLTVQTQPNSVQLQLNFRNCPRTFEDKHRKVNFAISYLKGTAPTHVENSLITLDLANLPAWEDNYDEFIELELYFELVGVGHCFAWQSFPSTSVI
jgi:hypothetical protein